MFILPPTWENDPIWLQSYFSNGLKPPTSYLLGVLSCFDPGIADSPTWCLVLDFSVSLLSPRPIGMADVVRRNPKRWWGWNTCKVPILTSGWVNHNNNNNNIFSHLPFRLSRKLLSATPRRWGGRFLSGETCSTCATDGSCDTQRASWLHLGWLRMNPTQGQHKWQANIFE